MAIGSSDPSRAACRSCRGRGQTLGKPNGYVLGQEAGGAFIGGLRYGEGVMYTRNAGDLKVFWRARRSASMRCRWRSHHDACL